MFCLQTIVFGDGEVGERENKAMDLIELRLACGEGEITSAIFVSDTCIALLGNPDGLRRRSGWRGYDLSRVRMGRIGFVGMEGLNDMD